jgi:hypothetical protein
MSQEVAARTGHSAMADLSPLWGEERQSDFGAVRSVDDPDCGKSLTANLRVESQSRFRPCRNQLRCQPMSEEGN